MTTIPQPTEVRAAQIRALEALGPTANPAVTMRALKQPPERAQRPAHGSPGTVDMAVRPLPAARPFVPPSKASLCAVPW